jgi:hypothetical protein
MTEEKTPHYKYPPERVPASWNDHRRWHVAYDLIYDGGSARWEAYYRTYLGGRIAVWWNVNIASWGGTVRMYKNAR